MKMRFERQSWLLLGVLGISRHVINLLLGILPHLFHKELDVDRFSQSGRASSSVCISVDWGHQTGQEN